MVKREIFIRTAILISIMIISIILVFSFFMVRNHRIGVKNRMLSFGVLVAGEVERFIQWDDRLAADTTLAKVMETNQNYEYLFILINGLVFADTFNGDVPSDLLAHGVEYPAQAYYWEFKDNTGNVYFDYVIPVMSTNAILRMGVMQRSIDQHLAPALVSIVSIGAFALLIGILLSYRIAVSSTREITLLADVIRKYNSNNTPGSSSDTGFYNSILLIPNLIESFQNLAFERKSAEENLKQSLEEKESLLAEIFHRTRNNMQVISSLLYIQAEKYSDINVDKIVEQTDNRIQAMSLVHQLLHDTNQITSISLKELVISEVSFLFQRYSDLSREISFENNIGDITLSFDMAIPLGLILNELVSNSLLHAFRDKETGSIKIKISRPKINRISIIYSDNGTGLPESTGEDETSFFGLKLVKHIVHDQLNGILRMKNCNGFYCHIYFDYTCYSARG